jgi:hypothetical protein
VSKPWKYIRRKNDKLAQEMKALRELRGETQKQFAKHFKIGRTNLSNWENYGLPKHRLVRVYVAHIMVNLRRRMRRPKVPGGYIERRMERAKAKTSESGEGR